MEDVRKSWVISLILFAIGSLFFGCSGPNVPQPQDAPKQQPQPGSSDRGQPSGQNERGIKAAVDAGPAEQRTQAVNVDSIPAGETPNAANTEIVVQEGHSPVVQVNDIQFSQDDRFLFSRGSFNEEDNACKVWDTRSGNLIRTLEKGDENNLKIEKPSSSRIAVSDQREGTLSVQDAVSGAVLLTVPSGRGNRYALTKDETRILTTCALDDNEVDFLRLWDIGSGKVISSVKAPEEYKGALHLPTLQGSGNVQDLKEELKPKTEVFSMVISDDARFAFLKLWQYRIAEVPLEELDKYRASAIPLDDRPRKNSEGKWMRLERSQLEKVQIWNLETGARQPSLKDFIKNDSNQVWSGAFSPDNAYFLTGNGNWRGSNAMPQKGWLMLFDVRTGDLKWRQEEELNTVHSVAFSHKGEYVACGSDNVPYILDATSGRILRRLTGFQIPVGSLTISPDGKYAAYGCADTPEAFVWNLNYPSLARRLVVNSDYRSALPPGVRDIQFSPNGRLLAISMMGLLRLWDMATGTVVKQLGGYDNIAFSPNSNYLASAGHLADELEIVDVNTGQKTFSFKGLGSCNACVHPLVWNPDGNSIAVYNNSGTQLIVVPSGQVANTISDAVGVRFAKGGKAFITSRKDSLCLVETYSGKTLREFGKHDSLFGQDPFRSFDLSTDDERVVATCGKDTVREWNVSTGELIKEWKIPAGGVFELAYTPDSKRIVVVNTKGLIQLFETASGALVFSGMAQRDSDNYLVWTPEGYFSGTDWAVRNLVHLTRGMDTFGLDQFFDRFYNPAMVRAKIMGYKVDAPRLDGVFASSPPPFVEITSPKMSADGKMTNADGSALNAGEVKVTARALDTGGGVKDIRLYHDGKRLEDMGEAVSPQEKTFEKTWTVNLIPGDNLLTAAAFSNEMLESRPFEVIVPYGKSEEKPDLYFLVVGVNTYGNEAYNLKLAHPDAESFGKDLPEHAKTVFGAMHAKQLYDDQASKQGILAVLAEMAQQAKPSDVFAFYFAGHGVVLEDTKQFYLATHGVSKLSSAAEPGSLATEGITDQELKDALQRIPALKQVVFLDACHSGTADLVAQAMGASDEVVIKKLSRASGTWVFTAADKQQYALEQTDLGHGLFTYALLKGIAGEADAGARDGYVKLSELETYIAETVQKLATKLNRDQQPKIYKGGDDFSIALATVSAATRVGEPQVQVASAKRSLDAPATPAMPVQSQGTGLKLSVPSTVNVGQKAEIRVEVANPDSTERIGTIGIAIEGGSPEITKGAFDVFLPGRGTKVSKFVRDGNVWKLMPQADSILPSNTHIELYNAKWSSGSAKTLSVPVTFRRAGMAKVYVRGTFSSKTPGGIVVNSNIPPDGAADEQGLPCQVFEVNVN